MSVQLLQDSSAGKSTLDQAEIGPNPEPNPEPNLQTGPTRRSREAILADLPSIAEEIAKGAVARELGRELPFEIFRTLRQTGLTWLRVPKHLGGPGGTLADQVEVIGGMTRCGKAS